MAADVLYAFSYSSRSLEKCVTGCDSHVSAEPLPQQLEGVHLSRAHPAMGDPFDVIPFDVRPISSAGQFTHKSDRVGY